MNKNINLKIKKIIGISLITLCTSFAVACSNNSNDTNKEESHTINNETKDENNNSDNGESSSQSAEKSGSIITLGDKAFEIFYGNEDVAKDYAKTISDHKENLGEEVKVYNMVIPTHVEFGLPKEYSHMSNSQKSIIDTIYDNLEGDINVVDVYDNLEKYKDEYIYFNTDHHWTSLGAYYAYVEFAKSAGFEVVDIDEYKKYSIEDFLGTFYTQTKDINLKNNPDRVDYYKISEDHNVYRYEDSTLKNPQKSTLYADYASGINSYSLFLHGDFPMVRIENNDKKLDKKLVVVKESYANAFVPFLVPHYEEVIVIDARYFEGRLDEVVNNYEADEVLFINNVFATNTESIVNKIADLNN